MRTTIHIDDDAMRELRLFAEAQSLPLGKAASELIRRGARFRIPLVRRDGLPVFDVPDDFPAVSDEQLRRILDEE